MGCAPTHISVAVSGILLAGGKTDVIFPYSHALIHLFAVRFHVLFSHIVSVVAHMNHGDAHGVVFGMPVCVESNTNIPEYLKE